MENYERKMVQNIQNIFKYSEVLSPIMYQEITSHLVYLDKDSLL